MRNQQSLSRIPMSEASKIDYYSDKPTLHYKKMCSFTASYTSTLLTEDFSDSDLSSSCSLDVGGDDSSGLELFTCESIEQGEDELSFAYGDDTWGCMDDDTRRTSDRSSDDYFDGEIPRSLSAISLEDTNNYDFRVRFMETVNVREFAITVGHQCASSRNLCPLTLDWHFSEGKVPLKIGEEKFALKKPVRRLSEHQRRSWISYIQGWPIEKVRSLEITRVIEAMEEVMQRQETFLDNLVESDDGEVISSDHMDSLRDWDEVVADEYKDLTKTSLLNVSRDLGVSFSDLHNLPDDETFH